MTMCKGSGSSGHETEKTSSLLFGQVTVFAVIVCIFGMLYCCISFGFSSRRFSKECEKVLLEISNFAISADTTSPPVDRSSSTSSDSSLDMSSEASPGTSSDKKDLIESLVTHTENMIAIQKSGMTNDLMSFIYGILSAVLVGLCATFVAKSRTNADEAKKTADKAKSSAEAAKKQAEIAENKAKQTKNAIMQAQKASDTTKKLGCQVKLVIISSRIASAKASLLALDNISANREITKIRDEISSLFAEDEFMMIIQSDDHDSMEIGKAYNELLYLQEDVDAFENECKKKYLGTKLKSMEHAAKNYHNWIQIAINCIDATVRTM